MTKKLGEKIDQYFGLMEEIRRALFRVMPVSDRYMCVVSFNTQLQAMQCSLVSKTSLLEAKLLDGLTGRELVAYGRITQKIEVWAAGGMRDEFPLSQSEDVYAEYVGLTRNEEENEQDRPNISDADLAAYVESLPKSEALKFVDPLSKYELAIICKAWDIPQDSSETVMLSLVKGHILRRAS